jgi:hypothetical protein
MIGPYFCARYYGRNTVRKVTVYGRIVRPGDWSFNQDTDYNKTCRDDDDDDDDFMINETTHIYVTHQHIEHFLQKHLEIKPEGNRSIRYFF